MFFKSISDLLLMKFLIVRTDRIGDLIISTSVFELVKRKFPDSKIIALVLKDTKDILLYNPYIDGIVGISRFTNLKDFLHLVRHIHNQKFDIGILLHPTFSLSLLLFLSRVKIRVGTGYRFYSLLFNRRVYEHRKDCKKHEAEYNLGFLKFLGIEGLKTVPKIFLSKEEIRKSTYKFKDKIVAIHPGSGGSARAWGRGHFAEIADLLARKGMRVYLTGSKKEKGLIDEIKSRMRTLPSILVGGTTLREFAVFLSHCSLLITNSTGPLHIAAAVGTPTISIFCPIAGCSPVRWGPLGRKNKVFIPEVSACKKCIGKRCRYYDCMDMIKPEAVFEEAKKVLKI